MIRRRVLARVGVGTAAVLGGCLTSNDAGGDEATTPGPPIDSESCPPYPVERDRAVCSHTVDPDTAPVHLTATPRSGTLDDGRPVDETTLTLYNQSASDLEFNHHSWRIGHLSDAGWTEMNRQRTGDGAVVVSAGDTYTWSFLDAVRSIQDAPELNPGLHTAEIGVPAPETDDEWIACITLVRFDSSE